MSYGMSAIGPNHGLVHCACPLSGLKRTCHLPIVQLNFTQHIEIRSLGLEYEKFAHRDCVF